MRIDELLEAKVQNSPSSEDIEIKRLFDEYFVLGLGGTTMIQLKPARKSSMFIKNGLVNVKGDCTLKKKTNKLPIKFGDVSGNFIVTNKGLTSLEGCPSIVGAFDCSNNKLENLIGGPNEVERYNCTNNKLTSLIGGPILIYFRLDCSKNPITSIEGLPKECQYLLIKYTPTLPLLRTCFSEMDSITFVPDIHANKEELNEILEKYYNTGRKGAIQCAAELSKAGFKGNARL